MTSNTPRVTGYLFTQRGLPGTTASARWRAAWASWRRCADALPVVRRTAPEKKNSSLPVAKACVSVCTTRFDLEICKLNKNQWKLFSLLKNVVQNSKIKSSRFLFISLFWLRKHIIIITCWNSLNQQPTKSTTTTTTTATIKNLFHQQ